MFFDCEQHKYQNLIQKMSMGSYGALTKKILSPLADFCVNEVGQGRGFRMKIYDENLFPENNG